MEHRARADRSATLQSGVKPINPLMPAHRSKEGGEKKNARAVNHLCQNGRNITRACGAGGRGGDEGMRLLAEEVECSGGVRGG